MQCYTGFSLHYSLHNLLLLRIYYEQLIILYLVSCYALSIAHINWDKNTVKTLTVPLIHYTMMTTVSFTFYSKINDNSQTLKIYPLPHMYVIKDLVPVSSLLSLNFVKIIPVKQ